MGAEWRARQVERVEAPLPEGLAQCAAGHVLGLAQAGDLGQFLVGGPAREVPGAQLAPVPGAPGWSLEASDRRPFEKHLKGLLLKGTQRAPSAPLSFGKSLLHFLSLPNLTEEITVTKFIFPWERARKANAQIPKESHSQ